MAASLDDKRRRQGEWEGEEGRKKEKGRRRREVISVKSVVEHAHYTTAVSLRSQRTEIHQNMCYKHVSGNLIVDRYSSVIIRNRRNVRTRKIRKNYRSY